MPVLRQAPATITYTVLVTAGTAAGTAINETASVTSAVTDPNSANNTATAADVVATATQADLVVTNSASPTSVAAGSNVTYTQTVTQQGPCRRDRRFVHPSHAAEHKFPVDHASCGMDLRNYACSGRHRNDHLYRSLVLWP